MSSLVALAAPVTGTTITELALTAVAEHHTDQTPQTVRPLLGGLFPARTRREPVDRVLITLYLTDAEADTLDGLASDAGVTRSDLVTRCVRAHLGRKVFVSLESLLSLSSLPDPVKELHQRLQVAALRGTPARALPRRQAGVWQELPEQWAGECAEDFEAARAAMSASSWTQVAWHVLAPSVTS